MPRRFSRLLVPAALAAVVALPTAARAADWPMFHRNPTHTGVAPETALGAASAKGLGARWQANTGAAVFGSPVVATDPDLGRRVVYIGNQAGTMSAYDAATGDRIWARDLQAAIASTPAVAKGVVYFGSHDHWLYALDGSTGEELCKFHTGGISTSSPVVANPDGSGLVVYFGDNGLSGNDDGGKLWAINAAAPSPAVDCGLRWSYDAWGALPGSEPLAGAWSPPAYVKDATGRPLVVVGGSSPDNAVYAFDAVTGARVWRFGPPNLFRDQDFGAGPTIGAPGVNGFPEGVVYIPGKNRVVYALDLPTGRVIWATNLDEVAPGAGGATRATAVLVGRKLVVGYGAGVVQLDAITGAANWTTEKAGVVMPEVLSSPAVSGASGDRVAFVQDTGGTLYGLGIATGAVRWSTSLDGPGFSSPAISDGQVFVGSGNGFLFSFGLGGGTTARPDTTLASPADGASLPNPGGDSVLSGKASDDVAVSKVLVAVKDQNGGRWWDPASASWSPVFTQWEADVAAPGTASTAWTARFPMPTAGGNFFAQAEAIDGDGQHDPVLPTARFFVESLGSPPDTTMTSPEPSALFLFPTDASGNVVRQPIAIPISGAASDTGGANPGVAKVLVAIRNREHGEYWCGPAGCKDLPAGTFWRPQFTSVPAALAAPGATETSWSTSFMSYDHPHNYTITAWAVDRDGEQDTSKAGVPLICVRDPGEVCHG